MSAQAAGEGENPLQRGVGSPIHTPTLGGGDCHTFIPFTSPILCTPLCLPLLFSPPRLIRIEMEQWGCLGGKGTLICFLALSRTSDTWLCPAVKLPAVKIFIKMKSEWSESAA